MVRGKDYSQKEIKYIEKYWGIKSIKEIAFGLNRSRESIKQKAKRLKLGGILNADEYLSANQIGQMLGKQANTVMRWVKNKGLKGKYKIMAQGKEKGVWRIKLDDLMKWLKNNQKWYDARKIIPYSLGTEPKWLREKRASDRKQWKRKFERWTRREEELLYNMHINGKPYKELMKIFDRSYDSIEKKLKRIRDRKTVIFNKG
jgi:transposase